MVSTIFLNYLIILEVSGFSSMLIIEFISKQKVSQVHIKENNEDLFSKVDGSVHCSE